MAAVANGCLDKWAEYLPEGELKQLCDMVCDLLLEESNVQPVSTPVTVCGDIHGQFYDLEAQMNVMDKTEDECLAMHQDMDTRWNSIYLMLARLACFPLNHVYKPVFRALELRPALQHIMADPAWEAKISQIPDRTFVLMEKVVGTLKDFFDATEALSSRSASIAEVVF